MNDESQKLKDYTDKINIAMKYNDNDMTRSKKIIEGSLKDFIAIKGKLFSKTNSKNGLFLIVLHKYKYYLLDKFSIFQDKGNESGTLNITDSWKVFFPFINEIIEKGDYLKDEVSKLNIGFEKEFRPAIISQMIEKFENKDLTYVTIQLEKICSYALGTNDFILQIDFENITSVEFEEIIKNAINEKRNKEESFSNEEIEKKLAQSNDPIEIEKNKLLAEGNVFFKSEISLSPIKGKFISELISGDIIGCRIIEKTPKAVNIIKQLNLLTPEGKIKKIKGKIVFVRKTEKGFSVFIQIAPLVIAEVLEEEEIKVEHFPKVGEEQAKKNQKNKNSSLAVIIVSSVVTAIVLTVVFLLIL